MGGSSNVNAARLPRMGLDELGRIDANMDVDVQTTQVNGFRGPDKIESFLNDDQFKHYEVYRLNNLNELGAKFLQLLSSCKAIKIMSTNIDWDNYQKGVPNYIELKKTSSFYEMRYITNQKEKIRTNLPAE